jgi:transposase-like protein
MRNLLARVPKSAQAMVAATVRTIFDQPDRTAAEAQLLQHRDFFFLRCRGAAYARKQNVGTPS